jgi:hypothetical protein
MLERVSGETPLFKHYLRPLALGVVTSKLISKVSTEKLGFFAVRSIEANLKCLEGHNLPPEIQNGIRRQLSE